MVTSALLDTPPLRWGIAGAGLIAADWVQALHGCTTQRVHAVAARDATRAADFAGAHGLPRSYGSYAALAADPDIDAVYVATITEQHLVVACELMAAGKHVLIEKPLAATADEARQLVEAAREHDVYVRENMWTLSLPQVREVDRLIADGTIGDVQLVEADFSSTFDPALAQRVFAPSIGAGALLDIGVYPLALAQHLLGAPLSTHTTGALTDRGVDRRAVVVSHHAGDALSISTTAVDLTRPCGASIVGTRGRIEFAADFYRPASFNVVIGDARTPWHPDPAVSGRDGLCHLAVEMAADIHAGRRADAALAASLTVLDTVDAARRQLGVTALAGR